MSFIYYKNFTNYNNILVETVILFNNKSLELFNNMSFIYYINLPNYNNILKYYYNLVETVILFNNKSLELFNNINFDNKLVNITVIFSIIALIQYVYIYYILGELIRLETIILNVTEDMIKENIEKIIEKDNIDSNKKQCFGFNIKKTNNFLRRNPKRNTMKDNNQVTKKPSFNEFYEEQKDLIKNNYPKFNTKEIYNHAKKCYNGGFAYVN
tara:strand:+ start:9292 stop:9927 length:636 start_codon:yes stop_codon:yes gene_type:complete